MSRFFKSAAFPILLVILLAFFVQNLFYGSRANEDLTFNDFQTAVAQGEIDDDLPRSSRPRTWSSRGR